MEILRIKENIGRALLQQSTQKPLKKPEQVKGDAPGLPDSSKRISKGNEEAIKDLTENINQFMKTMNYSLKFVPDHEAGTVVIKVLDGKGKVVRQIPPESLVEFSSKIESRSGLIINETFE